MRSALDAAPSGRGQPPRHGAVFLFSALLFLLPAGHSSGGELANPEYALVGVYINNRDSHNMDVYKSGGEFWLPLSALADLLNMRWQAKESIIEIVTPIGTARLPEEELGVFEGEKYISAPQLLDKLNILAKFSAMDFALFLDVPWRPGSNAETLPGAQAEIRPDVEAPSGAVSLVRNRGEISGEPESGKTSWSASADVGGRILGGLWMAGAGGAYKSDPEMRRYFWNRVFGGNVVRLGSNYVHLSPLLTAQEYEGAQWAFSNVDVTRYTDFSTNLNLDSMLADDVQTQTSITREDGPPGGIAELRIDDQPTAWQRITLEGYYEFTDIQRRPGVFQTIKVFLYARDINEQPVAILDYTRTVARQSLPAGELMARAGFGRQMNGASAPSGQAGGEAGFAQARYGLTNWLTVSATAQSGDDGEMETMAGARASVGRNWAWAMDMASRGGTTGFLSELQGISGDWDISARNFQLERGYLNESSEKTYDHYLRALYQFSPGFRLGLFGRNGKRAGEEPVNYAKPGLFVTPSGGLMISAYPNIDGNYRVSSYYQPKAHYHFSFLYENGQYSGLYFRGSQEIGYFTAGLDYNEKLKRSMGHFNLYYYFMGSRRALLQGGVSQNQDFTGVSASLRWTFSPGVEFSAEYSDGYRNMGPQRPGALYRAVIKADFANTAKGFSSSDNSLLNFSRGGIVGAVYAPDGTMIRSEGLGITINGVKTAQVSTGGGFYLGNVKPGIYIVELDEEFLPIEFVPERKYYAVEVAAGAVTRVDFTTRVFYGAAGKASMADGSPLPGARLIILNSAGAEAGSAITDQFGFYRMDGLAPGEYTLKLTQAAGNPLAEPVPSITFKITDDFLFDQNVTAPADLAPIPALKPGP